jgi:hypothetical protein
MTTYQRFFEVPRSDGGLCRISVFQVACIMATPAKRRAPAAPPADLQEADDDRGSAVTILLNNNTAIPVRGMTLEEVWSLYNEGCGHMVQIAKPQTE